MPTKTEPATEPAQRHFEVHLVAQDGTENWRRVTVVAPDEDEARFIMETRERAIVAHKLPDTADEGETSELDEHEAIETAALKAKEPVPPTTLSKLHAHRQDKPYKIASVKEVEVR